MLQKYKSPSAAKGFNYYLLPLLAIAFIPLIMKLHSYIPALSEYPWFDDGSQGDLFLYWKSMVFIILNGIMALILACRLALDFNAKGSVFKKAAHVFIPLAVYAFFVILSTVFSQYSYYGYHGNYEQFESLWVLLGYCLTAYYGFLFIRDEKDVRTLFTCILIGASLLALIGVFQAFSLDFYRSSFGQSLFLPSGYLEKYGPITFNFELGRVYTSLYNPNYVGTFVGLVAPVLIVFIFFCKKLIYRAAYILLLAGLLICLFGAQSRTGMIATAVSLFFLIILFRRYIFRQWKILLGGIVLITAAFLFMNAKTNNILIQRLTGMMVSEAKEPPLSEIQTNDDNVTIVYNKETLVIRFLVPKDPLLLQFSFTDQEGRELPQVRQKGTFDFTIDDPRFSSFLLKPVYLSDETTLGFCVTIDGRDWCFTNAAEDGTYYFFTSAGKLDKIDTAESSPIFKGKESLFSGRGFIWSRTIPLLKKYLFLGSGADTFVLAYPNTEYVEKYNYGYDNTLLTKPHNMYMQIGVQTGLLSLAAFLAFYIMYFVQSIRLYFKSSFDSYLSQVGTAILAGTMGYMVTGLANDSTITVAPIFWLLMGIGLSVNFMLNHQNKAAGSSTIK